MGVLSHIMYKFTVLPPTFANNECGSIFFVCLLSSQVQAASTIAQTHTSTLNSRWYGDGASILRTAPTTWHTHVSGPGGLNVRFFEVTCGRLQSQPGRFVRGHQGREMTTGKPIDLCTQSCRVRVSVALDESSLGFPTYYTRSAAATKAEEGLARAGFRLLGPPTRACL